MRQREEVLYQQLAKYLNAQYPDVIYHFDLSGVNNPSQYTRNLYGWLNARAWPDLFIAKPYIYQNASGEELVMNGLFLGLKREGTRVYKKDDVTPASPHVAEQLKKLDQLHDAGYEAYIAVGFDEARAYIDDYLAPLYPGKLRQASSSDDDGEF